MIQSWVITDHYHTQTDVTYEIRRKTFNKALLTWLTCCCWVFWGVEIFSKDWLVLGCLHFSRNPPEFWRLPSLCHHKCFGKRECVENGEWRTGAITMDFSHNDMHSRCVHLIKDQHCLLNQTFMWLKWGVKATVRERRCRNGGWGGRREEFPLAARSTQLMPSSSSTPRSS